MRVSRGVVAKPLVVATRDDGDFNCSVRSAKEQARARAYAPRRTKQRRTTDVRCAAGLIKCAAVRWSQCRI